MNLEHLVLRFEKLSAQNGLNFLLGKTASEADILQSEKSLTISFPEQVKLFYKNYNGLEVFNPDLEVLSLERIKFLSKYRLHFATFDGKHQVFFDTSRLNEADQWDILSSDGFRITLTMASFWSNKIWKWIESEKQIWREFPEW